MEKMQEKTDWESLKKGLRTFDRPQARQKQCRLFDLPVEIRVMVLQVLLRQESSIVMPEPMIAQHKQRGGDGYETRLQLQRADHQSVVPGGEVPAFHPAVLRTCQRLYHLGFHVLYKQNTMYINTDKKYRTRWTDERFSGSETASPFPGIPREMVRHFSQFEIGVPYTLHFTGHGEHSAYASIQPDDDTLCCLVRGFRKYFPDAENTMSRIHVSFYRTIGATMSGPSAASWIMSLTETMDAYIRSVLKFSPEVTARDIHDVESNLIVGQINALRKLRAKHFTIDISRVESRCDETCIHDELGQTKSSCIEAVQSGYRNPASDTLSSMYIELLKLISQESARRWKSKTKDVKYRIPCLSMMLPATKIWAPFDSEIRMKSEELDTDLKDDSGSLGYGHIVGCLLRRAQKAERECEYEEFVIVMEEILLVLKRRVIEASYDDEISPG